MCVRTCRACSPSSGWRAASSGASSARRYASSGAFASMTIRLPPGSRTMTSGRMRPSSSPGIVCCSVKSQCSTMPGELDDALQLELAPAAADAGTLERVGQAPRLVAQTLPGGVERGDLLHELRAGLDAPALGVLDLAVDLIERLRHRREQVLDRLLARVDVAGGLGARVAQAAFRPGRETPRCWSSAPRR